MAYHCFSKQITIKKTTMCLCMYLGRCMYKRVTKLRPVLQSVSKSELCKFQTQSKYIHPYKVCNWQVLDLQLI
jgi:hypothetical protein